MTNTTMGTALAAARRRNDILAAAYKSSAHRLLSRAVANVAASAADQRRELGASLQDMLAALPGPLADARLDLEEALLAQQTLPPGAEAEPSAFLSYLRDAEAADRELFAALAAAAAPIDQNAAIRLAAFSEQARKRATIAGDHLDLLSL